MTNDRTAVTISTALSTGGVPYALEVLNSGVPHRFTSIYSIDGLVLRNVHLFDKQREIMPVLLREVIMTDSFCQFALRDGLFRTNDSTIDPRLDGNKYQGVVISYHSVPILGNNAELWGTLSHFDFESKVLTDDEFDLLEHAARILATAVFREGSA